MLTYYQEQAMKQKSAPPPPVISDQEIEEAMSELEGFIDITPDDFRKIYEIAYPRALSHTSQVSPERKEPPSRWLALLRPVSEPAPRLSFREIVWSWIGAFVGIAAVAWLHQYILAPRDLVMIVGSFGASAVLIYGAIRSPLAQPRNLIGGHFFSAFVGVASWQLLSFEPWLAGSVAVATAIALMHFTRTLHPPGGATALIAVIGSEAIHNLGYLYAFVPILTGALIMLVVALLTNALAPRRRYPEFWL